MKYVIITWVFHIILYILGYIPVHSWLFLYILVLIQDNYLLGFYKVYKVFKEVNEYIIVNFYYVKYMFV